MKKNQTIIALSIMSLSVSAYSNSPVTEQSLILNSNTDSKNIVYQAKEESFKVCKDKSVNSVYKTKDGQVILSSAIDTQSIHEDKRQSWEKLFADFKHPNPKKVAQEYFNVLTFYLNKNHTVDLNKINEHLTYGQSLSVTIKCLDQKHNESNDLLIINKSGTLDMDKSNNSIEYTVLYHQKI